MPLVRQFPVETPDSPGSVPRADSGPTKGWRQNSDTGRNSDADKDGTDCDDGNDGGDGLMTRLRRTLR